MSRLLLLAAVLIYSQLFAQPEFKTYPNGLIYSEQTMHKLNTIADSLNLKFKVCDFNKVFYSKYQTVAHIITLDTGNIKQAKADIDNGLPYENFICKYPLAEVKENVLVVRYTYKDYKEKDVVEFQEIELNDGNGFEIRKDNPNGKFDKPASGWLYSYYDASDYSSESLEAFYFIDKFKSMPIAPKYCRQIGYADCLIDTVATKFRKNAEQGWVELPSDWQSMSEKDKKSLLEKMRSTQVIGGCSMDSRPREHAMHIALLSAETTKWEVFLKSHLDIMNDRFERVTDGSYAWGERKTYIKELEELDINVPDLLTGISLRIENPAKNHYFGSIYRLGRAIAESKDQELFKLQMLSMIEDKDLDDFNRVLAYFLFLNYNHYLENKEMKEKNLQQLAVSILTLPQYLKSKINLDGK